MYHIRIKIRSYCYPILIEFHKPLNSDARHFRISFPFLVGSATSQPPYPAGVWLSEPVPEPEPEPRARDTARGESSALLPRGHLGKHLFSIRSGRCLSKTGRSRLGHSGNEDEGQRAGDIVFGTISNRRVS